MAVACLLCSSGLWSQQQFDVRFTVDSIACESRQICYNTQVRSGDGTAWNLAGQNYRIYYDASMASYVEGSAERVLDPDQYSEALITADVQGVDASGFPGDLPFKATLGFLNYSVDLMNLTNGGIDLPANGDYMSTTKICFELTQEVIDNGSECLSLVWAQMGKTDGIATAFVEISEWAGPNVTTPAEGNEFDDLDADDGDGSCISSLCGGDGNENTDLNCADGIDNDNDGLIDCADPDCAATLPCAPPANEFNVELAFNNIDCSTRMACYDINIGSANDSSFILGSQRYQLFYNSAVGSYVSGASTLGSDYQDLALQASTPIENVAAVGVGDLPFEATLGFINFTIQLADPTVGSTVEVIPGFPVKTGELCFVMSESAVAGADDCFEATWARFGVTEPYNGSMVEVDAWMGPDLVMSTLPVADGFGDIDSSTGDGACFDVSCPVGVEEGNDIDCNDNIDNDNDGLIDCLDPSCGPFADCATTCNSVVPDLTAEDSALCDYTVGTVTLTATGGNQTDNYTTTYVLTAADGTIIDVTNGTPTFDILNEGFFNVYAINFRSTTVTLTGATVDSNIADITGDDDCFVIGSPVGFTVCNDLAKCNFCLGETVTTDLTLSDDPQRTNNIVLTDENGIILIIGTETTFADIGEGVYVAYGLNFASGTTVAGLEVGSDISAIAPGSLVITDTELIGVCDQLNPTIFFDLKGCDITTTAILQVGETFDSYLWSTGSEESFIEVSATDPANYTVTVTLSNGCIGVVTQEITGDEIATVGDFVWEDLNGNGRQDANESGLNGVTVNLFTDFDNNGAPDFADFPSCTTTTGNHPDTGEPGYYEFKVYRSSYIVGVESPQGFVPTTQNQGDGAGDSDINDAGLTTTIAVVEGENKNDIDAGFRTSTGVGGFVWEDGDGDGRRDETEVGVDGVTINLYSADGERIATTVSLTDPVSGLPGFYCFDNVPVRDYYVEIILPSGKVLTLPNVSTDESRDSDATGINGPGTTALVSTNSGVKTMDVDFGIYTGGTVCGLLWQENEMGTEGIYDEGVDSLVANSEVLLLDNNDDQIRRIAVTDENGRYCLNSIIAGSYKVSFRANTSGEFFVNPNQGDDPLLDSDVDVNSGTTGVFFVSPADTVQGINGGLRMETLPVELTAFSGRRDAKNNTNVLDWTTASEINNDRFEIERLIGSDGEFELAGTVDGNGTSTDVNNYSFVDGDISRSGTYYYRLKQMDYDGGYEYSEIIAIDVVLNAQPSLKAYPNPVSVNTQLDLFVMTSDVAEVTMTDLMGRTVRKSTSHQLAAGLNTIDINCADLSVGTYIVLVRIGDIQQYELIQVTK